MTIQPNLEITLDPRESMKALPMWLQSMLTRTTAKPYQGQLYQTESALSHLFGATASIITGVSLSSASLLWFHLDFPLVPLGWAFTVHGLHKLHLTIRHACSHSAVSGNPKLDSLLGNAISILTVSMNYEAYKKRHIKVHHAAGLLKPGDGTYEFLINTVGLRPDMTLHTLWKTVLLFLISPQNHIRECLQRFMDCFLSKDNLHNLAAFLFWGTILTIVHINHYWLIFALVWGLPISILFNTVTALRLLVEHRWPDPKYRNARHREALATMTAAIFFGEATPSFSKDASKLHKLYRWTIWWTRFLLYHLPARALVLPGDAPCHDFHHRRPRSTEWTHAYFARQQDLDKGCPGWPKNYIHSWGLGNAINDVLISLTKQSNNILN